MQKMQIEGETDLGYLRKIFCVETVNITANKIAQIAQFTRGVQRNPVQGCFFSVVRSLALNKIGAVCIFMAMCFVLTQNILERIRIQKCPGTVHPPPFIILVCRLTFVILSIVGGLSMVLFAYTSLRDSNIRGMDIFSLTAPLSIILEINLGVAIVNIISFILLLVNYKAVFANPKNHRLCNA